MGSPTIPSPATREKLAPSTQDVLVPRKGADPDKQTRMTPLLPACRLLAANIFDLFFTRGFSEKCYSFPVGFLFHEEGSSLPAKIF